MHKMNEHYLRFLRELSEAKDTCNKEFAEDICIDCKFNTTPGDFTGSCLLMTNYLYVSREKR